MEEKYDLLWYDSEESQIVSQNTLFDSVPPPVLSKGFLKRRRVNDQEVWESSLLSRTGLTRSSTSNVTEEEKRVAVIARDFQPPFLKQSVVLMGESQSVVNVVKDPASDMAVLAKRGSLAVQRIRLATDRSKVRERFWEVAGSRIGKVMGIKSSEIPEEIKTEQHKVSSFSFSSSRDAVLSKVGLSTVRRTLPIFACKKDLVRLIRENQVIVVVGETGSGKTTQLTQYLLEAGFSGKNRIIACTQPRRVAAVSVAKRVSEEMDCDLGSRVGYSIRFEDLSSEDTEIKYMTDGVLLRESLLDSELEKYSVVIMDEAHERSLNTDVLFGVLKKVLEKRIDFRLVVTSATLDAKKFSDFFHACPIYEIPGRTYPVEVFYARTNPKDYVESAVDQVISIHASNADTKGDILVFMTGQEDVEATCILLADRLESLVKKMEDSDSIIPPLTILPMYSQLPSELQVKIFETSEYRKVIVATNVAETSLTVDGIKFVVDSGFGKIKVYNPKIGIDSLQINPISQANANQRKGRAGRTEPGICWRLYTEHSFYSDLFVSQVPEIQRTNLSNVVLLLKSLGVSDILKFDFMDPPPLDTLLNSMKQLWYLEALDDFGQITELGKLMSSFPLDPPLSRMILSARNFGCVHEVSCIVAMLSVPAIFYRPKEQSEASDAAKEKFLFPDSDHLTFLNVYKQWKKNWNFGSSWCLKHFLNHKALLKVDEIRQQISEILSSLSIEESCTDGRGDWEESIKKAILPAYLGSIAKLKGIGEYVNLISSVPSFIHPSSSLFFSGMSPEYIVYHEVIRTTKEYMNCITAIDPLWVKLLGERFFITKQSACDVNSDNLISIEKSIDEERQRKVDEAYSNQSNTFAQSINNDKAILRQSDSELIGPMHGPSLPNILGSFLTPVMEEEEHECLISSSRKKTKGKRIFWDYLPGT